MKTLVTLIMLCALWLNVTGQAPQKMSYQAVIRDAAGDLVKGQAVGMKVSILQGSVTGSVIYSEAVTPAPQTNENGLVSIEIGGGDGFDTINWGNGIHFIRTETDPAGGTNYTIIGTSQLLSVPYALYAKTAEMANDEATRVYVNDIFKSLGLLHDNFEGLVYDAEGNFYKTVKIGDQIWMAENLALLPAVSPPSPALTAGLYYYVYDYYGTDVALAKATPNYSTYGVLYSWLAALTACPAGWHLPTDAEWTTLTNYLINNGYGYEGSGDDIAKSMASTTNWIYSSSPGTPGNDPSSNNGSGFSALSGGYFDRNGHFTSIGYTGIWWSSSQAPIDPWCRRLSCESTDVYREPNRNNNGYSVRCVRD